MDTIADYLSKTESASKKLFEGVDSYLDILNNAHSTIFTSVTADDTQRQQEYEAWEKEHKEEIVAALKEQDRFVDEMFAMSSLCGALLQLASMGIQTYSSNTDVPENFQGVINTGTKAAKFCIGRLERDIPIGLLIYAGRNQCHHLDEEELREPNIFIFEKLCQIESFANKGTFYRDSAFDLNNDIVINYAHNITSVIGWRNYETYEKDLMDMLA